MKLFQMKCVLHFRRRKWNLEERDDYSVLPDGTLQPKNLFQAMSDVMKASRDDFGLNSLFAFFGQNNK